jgi:hypothetical protein
MAAQDQDGAIYTECHVGEASKSYKSKGSTLFTGMHATRGAKLAAWICFASPEIAGKRSVYLAICLIK